MSNYPILMACQEVSASSSMASPLWKRAITAGNSSREAKKLRAIMETISIPTTMYGTKDEKNIGTNPRATI